MDLLARYTSLKIKKETYEQTKEKTQGILKALKKTVEGLNEEITILNDTQAYLRLFLEKYSDSSLKLFTELLNNAFDSIFFDRGYSVSYKIYQGKKKDIKFFLDERIEGNLMSSGIPNEVAGSVNVVFSFLLQLFLIRMYNLRPLMVIDEGVSKEISTKYLTPFLSFVKTLVSSMGFNFIWVTHDERIINDMDLVYRISNGTSKLVKGDLNNG